MLHARDRYAAARRIHVTSAAGTDLVYERGDPKWSEKAWAMFNAIDKATRTEHGNSAVHDVTVQITELSDQAESFWTAETLKYFYLIWSEPSLVSLDEWVLNTEAHPFRWSGEGSGMVGSRSRPSTASSS